MGCNEADQCVFAIEYADGSQSSGKQFTGGSIRPTKPQAQCDLGVGIASIRQAESIQVVCEGGQVIRQSLAIISTFAGHVF
jgi:hypothetical protein